MPRTALEEELTTLTREFVSRIVAAIRNASFADVASLSSSEATPAPAPRPAARPSRARPTNGGAGSRSRQTADKRAELATRVLHALAKAGEPLGVRALSSELHVAPDLLAAPLKELRTAGKIAKHGDKRAARYGVT
jgi:hypothetical protein